MRLTVSSGLVLLFASVALAAPVSVPETSWTLAILPDTQHYEGENVSIFAAQTQFLSDYKDELNLAYVLQEGDVTQNNYASQWTVASNAFATLETAGIPFTIVPGNHDITPSRSSLISTYFPVSRLDNQPTFGGVYGAEPTSTQNTYSLFSAGGTDWLVIGLEIGPRDGVLSWAKNLMTNVHPDRQAMIVTHANLFCDSTLYNDISQHAHPDNYNLAGGCNDGAEMWEMFQDCANLKFVFSGHVLEDQTGYLAQAGTHGNVVHNMLANYQNCDNGGDGYMRLLEFVADGTVHVRTYSPTRGLNGEYLDKPDQDFVIGLDSLPAVITHAVGANLVVDGPAYSDDNAPVTIHVPQSGSPTVGIPGWQSNRGDFELVVGNRDLTYKKGVLLANVTQSIRDGYHATVEVGRDSFGDGQLALSIMRVGDTTELNFNTSVAWFEFDAGWRAAHINADGTIAAGNGVTSSMVTKVNTGRFTVDLGVDSAQDGLLFVIGNNNSNKVVQTGVLADGAGWDIRVQTNSAQFAATGTDADWSLVYLPLDAEGLVGGLYDGLSETDVLSAGAFDMSRESAGKYVLSIPGESPETGMLILSAAYETTYQGITAPDDNILNYEAGANGTFIINSFDLKGSTTIGAQDTKFVWAFIDFGDPIATLPGDANGDCVVDSLDAQALAANWLTPSGATRWDGDFNADGRVDDLDLAILSANWQPNPPAGSVPEPSSIALLGAVVAFLTLWRSRRVL